MKRARTAPPVSLNPLSFEHRLHHRWEYVNFFNQAEVFRLSECTIFRIPNERGHFRLGVTVKARASSVERNRAKRTLREFFRKNSNILGSFDYNVVIPGHKKLVHPYAERLARSLKELVRVLG